MTTRPSLKRPGQHWVPVIEEAGPMLKLEVMRILGLQPATVLDNGDLRHDPF